VHLGGAVRPVGLARRRHTQEGGRRSRQKQTNQTGCSSPGGQHTKSISLPCPTPPHKSRDPCGKYRAGTLAAKCVYKSDTARHTRAIKAKLSRSPCRAKQRQAQNMEAAATKGGSHPAEAQGWRRRSGSGQRRRAAGVLRREGRSLSTT
jgi:hypothetical protein